MGACGVRYKCISFRISFGNGKSNKMDHGTEAGISQGCQKNLTKAESLGASRLGCIAKGCVCSEEANDGTLNPRHRTLFRLVRHDSDSDMTHAPIQEREDPIP